MRADRLWVDASAGVAGDMLLGALLDAGAPLAAVRDAVSAVVGDAVRIEVREVRRAGLRAAQAVVTTEPDPPERRWRDLRQHLAAAELQPALRATAVRVFERLATAEAAVHGIAADDVHFHEVGALDAVADVVGCCAALAALGQPELTASPVAVGSGRVTTAHGELPVPVPAVVELLRGAPVTAGGEGELATPTGAALLATLASGWGPLPPMTLTGHGLGAGTREAPDRANVVRVLLGETAPAEATEDVALVLESNVDDLDPRLWPEILIRLLAAGASDAWLTPILMKKGRPAHTLAVLVPADRAAAVRDAVFAETSAIGLRESRVAKRALARTEHSVEVSGCPVRVKVARHNGVVVNAQPEWEDVAAAARALGRPAKAVLAEAVAAVRAGGLAP